MSILHLNSGLAKAALVLVVIATVSYYVNRRYLQPPLVMDGSSSHDFRPVARRFKQIIESRSESGAGFAVYFKGEAVLEMTAGYRDLDYLVPWSHTTLAYGMSICKAVAALCLAQLVDRGFANYSEPVAKYWPEFGQAGKESITLRQLLSHQAGLVGLDRRLKFSEIAENAPVVAEILAKQKPALPLGTVAYHGLTFGLYADQLIRRIDPKGRSIDQYFHEEIAKPASVEAYIGLSRYQFYRLARVHFSIGWNLLAQLLTLDIDALNSYLRPGLTKIGYLMSFEVIDTDVYLYRLNDPDVAALPFSSVNLVTNAASLARLFSLIASNGTIDGKRIIGPDTLAGLFDSNLTVSTDFDPGNGLPVTVNAGFFVRRSPLGSTMIGHLGFGGQLVWSDLEHSVTIAYLTNHLRPCSPKRDWIHAQLIESVYETIAKIAAKKKSKK
ncbi:hypothetical protein BOX15_Mlig012895g1 [Macrostomum lignano]|uniref:Uncharacterized protein n=2 Tax=Macrostomum lignano TaxID=282301 RepID=A0A267EKE9_9PLAT|nr:hypothetical protein BOX15_Mlig012895g1 [Macrostomum lignano]